MSHDRFDCQIQVKYVTYYEDLNHVTQTFLLFPDISDALLSDIDSDN